MVTIDPSEERLRAEKEVEAAYEAARAAGYAPDSPEMQALKRAEDAYELTVKDPTGRKPLSPAEGQPAVHDVLRDFRQGPLRRGGQGL